MPEPTAFSREVVARLPLAQAVLTTLAYLWRDDFLDDCFRRHAGRHYQQEISFAHLVELLSDALLQRQGSLAASLEYSDAPVATRQAYYGKLRRLPLPLSVALLREAAYRLRPLLPTPTPATLPDCLDGWEVRMLDGKKLKRVAKRLLTCRGAAGKLFGGKLLVSWNPRSELADAVAADPDGEVNECTLVPALLAELPSPTADRPGLLVADRQFGDLTQPGRFQARASISWCGRMPRPTSTPTLPSRSDPPSTAWAAWSSSVGAGWAAVRAACMCGRSRCIAPRPRTSCW